jgi:hypothetical protein
MSETISKAEIEKLLAFSGASTRLRQPLEGGVLVIDFRDTDTNEQRLDALLSSQGIPFYLERASDFALHKAIRLDLTLPKEKYADAAPLLKRATELALLEVVTGIGDLISR